MISKLEQVISLSLSLSLSLSIVLLCPDLGNSVNKGRIEFSQALGEQNHSTDSANNSVTSLEGGYPEGSIATVTCNEGYRTDGSCIICHNGFWSRRVPECTSESLFLELYHALPFYTLDTVFSVYVYVYTLRMFCLIQIYFP